MVINKANWETGTRSEAFPQQTNAVDNDCTYMLDNRAGQSDILASNINALSGSSIQNTAALTISPSAISIGQGTLLTGSKILGDSSQNDPLRFGFISIDASSFITSYTVLPTQYNVFVLQFTGIISSGTSITINLPAVAGYVKVIDNQTTVALVIQTPAAANSVTINIGKQSTVYCDGTNITAVSIVQPYNIIEEQTLKLTKKLNYGEYGNAIYITTSTSIVNLTSSQINPSAIVFGNVEVGDILGIDFSVNLTSNFINLVNPANIGVSVTYNGISVSPPELLLTANSGGGTLFGGGGTFIFDGTTTLFTAVSSSSHSFGLYVYSTNGLEALFNSPITLRVTQYRP